MTPQEAVDMVTQANDFHARMISKDEFEVWDSGWNVRVAGQKGGFAMRWPPELSWSAAQEIGRLDWSELGRLECMRITNYVTINIKEENL